MKRLEIAALVPLILALSGVAGASEEVAQGLEGDLEYGEYLSSECVTCHNVHAPGENIPSLNGMPPKKLVEVLRAYKAKKLRNPTMQTVAARLDDEQIASLALYFATLEVPGTADN